MCMYNKFMMFSSYKYHIYIYMYIHIYIHRYINGIIRRRYVYICIQSRTDECLAVYSTMDHIFNTVHGDIFWPQFSDTIGYFNMSLGTNYSAQDYVRSILYLFLYRCAKSTAIVHLIYFRSYTQYIYLGSAGVFGIKFCHWQGRSYIKFWAILYHAET